MTLEKGLAAFLDMMLGKNRSAATLRAYRTDILQFSRWREIRARNDNACGESKSQNSHDSPLDLTFLIAATDPKDPIY